MLKHLANIITISRIFCSILILFYPPFSSQFYKLYIYNGLSDMLDGTIARLLNSASKLGAKLDTISDFFFAIVSLIKLLPFITLSKWIWIWTLIVFLIKMANLVSSYIIHKRFLVEHSLMNKFTGLILFLFPLSIPWIDLKISAFIICFIATFAAIEENCYIRKGKEIC